MTVFEKAEDTHFPHQNFIILVVILNYISLLFEKYILIKHFSDDCSEYLFGCLASIHSPSSGNSIDFPLRTTRPHSQLQIPNSTE